MVTVAMSSSSTTHKCWSSQDGPRVAQVLNLFQSMYPNIPTFAFGASSGGRLVNSILPVAMKEKSLPLAGYISQIMGPNPKLERPPSTVQQQRDNGPAMVYITMPKDVKTLESVKRFLETVTEKGNPIKHIEVKDHAIGPSFFHDRIPGIPLDLSTKLFEALQKNHWLDTETLKLTADPRRNVEWKMIWKPILLLEAPSSYQDDLMSDHSPLSEVMNVAYGRHEMTRDGVAEALDWLLEKATLSQPVPG